MVLLHGHQGQAEVVLTEAQGAHGGLHGDGVALAEEGTDEGHELALEPGSLRHVPGEELVGDGHRLLGHHVGEHRDAPLAPHGQDGDDLVVIAGVDVQLVPHQGEGLHDLGDVAVGLLGCWASLT